jgi:hypothetical protein
VTLTVSGGNFVAASVVHWNGAPRSTTYVNKKRLRATITSADLAAPASVPVTVVTPAPGGGTSTAVTFTVTEEAPTSLTLSSTSTTSSTLSTEPDRDIVIDNADAGVQDAVGGRTFTGTWCQTRTRTSFGPSSLFACGDDADSYRWTPQIGVSGVYEVHVWVPAAPSLSRSVPFVVAHAGGTTMRTLNQQFGRGRWVLHGRYFFRAGNGGYVETRSEQARIEGGTAGADAVRFVRRR